jgi:Spy/CpxP family protein refolding chaperone
MSYFSQNKTTLWILAAVVLFNIAALATIYYKMNYSKCDNSCKKEEQGCFQTYLKQELNLTPIQAEKFEVEKNRYHDTVSSVHRLMIEKRELMTAEMTRDNADTAILYKTSDELGLLYAKTRKLYINHYFELSKICTAEQKKKLASIIGNVFCCEGRNDVMGPDKKHRKQHHGCNAETKNKY